MTEFIKLKTPQETIQIGFTDQKVSGRAGLLTFGTGAADGANTLKYSSNVLTVNAGNYTLRETQAPSDDYDAAPDQSVTIESGAPGLACGVPTLWKNTWWFWFAEVSSLPFSGAG